MGTNNGTSIVEQSLFYFIREFFPGAINRYPLKTGDKSVEVDIFIPSLDLAIEYDGGYWHKDKVSIDNKKTKLLNSYGIAVIRIRDYGLPKLEPFGGYVIERPHLRPFEMNFDYINKTIEYISYYVEEPLMSRMKDFFVDEKTYEEHLQEIYALRYSSKESHSLMDMCGIELWNYELNAPLDPQNIPWCDWAPAYLTCNQGRNIVFPRYYNRISKSMCQENEISCSNCVYAILCPLLGICYGEAIFKDDFPGLTCDHKSVDCIYLEKKIWELINKGETLKEYFGYNSFISWLCRRSTIADKILDTYSSKKTTMKTKKNIIAFMGVDIKLYEKEINDGSFDIYSLF